MNRAKIFFMSQFLVVIFLGTIFSFFGVPNFFGGSSVEERILIDDWKDVSFTGTVLFEVPEEKGQFRFENFSGNELLAFSKDFDLKNFTGKEVVIEGKEFFSGTGLKDLEIIDIKIIEEKIFEEPKKFFLENKFGGYGFKVDENIFTSVKGGSKTFLKNGSGEVVLKFFSHDFAGKGNFFSEGSNLTVLNGINGEIKSLENGQEIFLKNPKKSYGVLIQSNYGVNLEKMEETKSDIYNFLQSFVFIEKENISKEKCGGNENLFCEQGYFCELFSTDKNASGRCVEL